jgi:1A family penicillin-binding protein
MRRSKKGSLERKSISSPQNVLQPIGKPFYFFIYTFTTLVLFLSKLSKKIIPKIEIRPKKKPSLVYRISLKIFNFLISFLANLLVIILHFFILIFSGFYNLIKIIYNIKEKISRFRVKVSFIRLFVLFFLLIASFSVLIFYHIVLKDLPSPDRLITRNQDITTKIYDRHGQLLYKVYLSQNRTLVKIENLPQSLIDATIAIEDRDFYKHQGLSIRGIIRAIKKNIFQQKTEGGSTITQQLVKNALLTSEKTFSRKLKEAILAIKVEAKFTKKEILQMYLNEVNYGGPAYGIEEAAQMYFGKHAKDLNLPESALLAGLPASPTRYSPFGSHPEYAKTRQIEVLRNMVENSFITPQEAEKATSESLEFAPQKTDILAPHFVMYVKDLLVQKYGQETVEQGGLHVITSLDLNLQEMAQNEVAQEVEKLKRLKVSNGAALITNPKTGEILAMVGSTNYFDQEHDGAVNVTLRPRQPGSSIKPINYSYALGHGFTPSSVISDSPVVYRIPGAPPYAPQNYDGRFHGNVTLRTALASSYNVPAIKVLASYGVQKMVEQGKAMGITTWEDSSRFGLSLTLGGGEVKMVDMAVVYGTLANLGLKVPLKPILAVTDYAGKVLEKNGRTFSGLLQQIEESSSPVLDPNIAYLLTDILKDNQARTPAFGSHSNLIIPGFDVAVKTGTSNNLRDNWTLGFTPSFLATVWVGNNDNSPMSRVASGLTGASTIWHNLMVNLLKDRPNESFPAPSGLQKIKICALTGELPCTGCPTREEYFLPGTQPKKACSEEFIRSLIEKKKEEENKEEDKEEDKILEGISTQR